FREQDTTMQSIADYEIKYALINHQSTLYCGGYNLFRYNEKKNALSKYAGGQGTEIWSMFSVNDSLLLLGRTNGFQLFNSNSKKFDSLAYAFSTVAEAKFVYRFFKNGTDTIWAVAENGLYKIIRGSRQWSINKEQSPVI